MKNKSYKFEFVLETGFAGAVHRDIIELPMELTEEEIEEEYKDWKNDKIDGYWACIGEVDDECNS